MSNEKLVREIQSGYNAKDNMQKLFEQNKKYIHRLIKRNGITDNKEDIEDAVQNAFLGLLKAVEKFDVNRGTKFLTIATDYMNTAIRSGYDYVNSNRCISAKRGTSECCARVMRIQKLLTYELGREPTIEEISARAEIGRENVVNILRYASSHSSIYDTVPDSDDVLLIDALSDNNRKTAEEYERKELICILYDSISRLPEFQKDILLQSYIEEKSAIDIANSHNVTVGSVYNNINRALYKLRINKKLKAAYYA